MNLPLLESMVSMRLKSIPEIYEIIFIEETLVARHVGSSSVKTIIPQIIPNKCLAI